MITNCISIFQLLQYTIDILIPRIIKYFVLTGVFCVRYECLWVSCLLIKNFFKFKSQQFMIDCHDFLQYFFFVKKFIYYLSNYYLSIAFEIFFFRKYQFSGTTAAQESTITKIIKIFIIVKNVTPLNLTFHNEKVGLNGSKTKFGYF